MFGRNIELIAISHVYKLYVSIYFVSECQVTEPRSGIAFHDVTEIN
jgi:hypothetical protein